VLLIKRVCGIIWLGQKEISVKQMELIRFENKQMLYLYKSINVYAGGRVQLGRAKGQAETVRRVPKHGHRR